ncbi:MAG: DUF2147 domain-containing protein [Saprospiraceae bacterium]|nr:DUF2147 domain-containing protein [Saprospiraceae bacterium]
MNRILFTVLFSICNLCLTFAQNNNVLGKWKTIDDTNGKAKSIVEIYLKDGKLFAKVIELLEAATTKVCNHCPGEKAGKSLMQMDIIWNMTASESDWDGGQIVDPKNGKVYSCIISLESVDKLKVRGYFGLSLIGRTQYWYRVK